MVTARIQEDDNPQITAPTRKSRTASPPSARNKTAKFKVTQSQSIRPQQSGSNPLRVEHAMAIQTSFTITGAADLANDIQLIDQTGAEVRRALDGASLTRPAARNIFARDNAAA
jgi:hypothetical protein